MNDFLACSQFSNIPVGQRIARHCNPAQERLQAATTSCTRRRHSLYSSSLLASWVSPTAMTFRAYTLALSALACLLLLTPSAIALSSEQLSGAH